jgi:protein O-GlcNAc transferase
MNLEQILAQALQSHRAGRLAEAEGLYRKILASDPNHADALHGLGLLENQKGRPDVGEGLIRRAIGINSWVANYWIDLGVILSGLGRFEEAVGVNRQALSIKPGSAEGNFNLATALSRLGRFEEALPIYHAALALRPNYPECLTNLGFALTTLGKPEISVDSCRKIIALRPDFAEAHYNLSSALLILKRFDESLASLRQAIRFKPGFAEAHNGVGVVMLELGRPEEAAEACRQALDYNPEFADALINLGNALLELRQPLEALAMLAKARNIQPNNAIVHYNAGNALKDLRRTEQAIAAYKKALELKPDYVKAANNLGLMLSRVGRHEEAEAAYRHALESDPNCAEAYNNLGKTLKDQGRMEQAIEVLPRAMEINPGYAFACNNLGIVLTDMGQVEKGLDTFRRAMEIDPSNAWIHSNLVFSLHYLSGNDGKAILDEARRWDARHAEPLRKNMEPHANNRDPGRKLKVGYISCDFRDHAVSRFIYRLFQNHDRSRFEIACYADVANPDGVTDSLRACVDAWHDIGNMTDERVAELIRGHGVDILVDLTGHTTGSHLLALARKPAPIQMNYLGYPGTTGLPTIDYRMTDALADPIGMTEEFYTEKLVRLPRTNWCYATPDHLPEVAAGPASMGKTVCFGSFNKLAKISAATIDLWAGILKEVDGSRLFLKDRALADAKTQERIRREFESRGVNPERLKLAGFESDVAAHFRAYGEIDIALDTFPYHGTTTTCEAFWMGVPVVTLAGATHVARVGASLLTSVGLGELIANRPEEYVSIAAWLARDAGRLKEIRGTLRERMRGSALMDGAAFARDVEGVYRDMWRRWCDGA